MTADLSSLAWVLCAFVFIASGLLALFAIVWTIRESWQGICALLDRNNKGEW